MIFVCFYVFGFNVSQKYQTATHQMRFKLKMHQNFVFSQVYAPDFIGAAYNAARRLIGWEEKYSFIFPCFHVSIDIIATFFTN